MNQGPVSAAFVEAAMNGPVGTHPVREYENLQGFQDRPMNGWSGTGTPGKGWTMAPKQPFFVNVGVNTFQTIKYRVGGVFGRFGRATISVEGVA